MKIVFDTKEYEVIEALVKKVDGMFHFGIKTPKFMNVSKETRSVVMNQQYVLDMLDILNDMVVLAPAIKGMVETLKVMFRPLVMKLETANKKWATKRTFVERETTDDEPDIPRKAA